MSDEQGPAGMRERKRPGPTIDLQAQEIASAPVTEPMAAGTERPQAKTSSGETNPRGWDYHWPMIL